jgi:hypothetical protein
MTIKQVVDTKSHHAQVRVGLTLAPLAHGRRVDACASSASRDRRKRLTERPRGGNAGARRGATNNGWEPPLHWQYARVPCA